MASPRMPRVCLLILLSLVASGLPDQRPFTSPGGSHGDGGGWTVSLLSQPRRGPATVVLGDEVILVGGYTSGTPSRAVDIFDTATGEWSTASLSEGRAAPQMAILGTALLIVGGGDVTGHLSSVVDVYDSGRESWNSRTLLEPWVGKDVITVARQAVFPHSGGAEIYDAATGTWSRKPFSPPRTDLAIAVLGHAVIFAGGTVEGRPSPAVDIYDAATAQWSSATLSEPRSGAAAAVVGGRALFAGGDGGVRPSSAVDIYDGATAVWSQATLTEPGTRKLVGVVVGERALFTATGSTTDPAPSVATVNIYDARSGGWSTATRSHLAPSWPLRAMVAGAKALFTTGYDTSIHIYDGDTDEWSATRFPAGRTGLVQPGLTMGSKLLLPGGESPRRVGSSPTDIVDVYDTETSEWSRGRLSEPNERPPARIAGSAVVFLSAKTVDVYDSGTGGWTSSLLSEPRALADAAIEVAGNKVLIAGGTAEGRASPGVTGSVEAYDPTTGRWSTARLSEARRAIAAAAVGTKVVFAGGLDHRRDAPSHAADVYHASSGRWSSTTLPDSDTEPGASSGYFGVALGRQALFYYTNDLWTRQVHVYDSATEGWRTFPLSLPRQGVTVGAVGATALLAGGSTRRATHLFDDVASDVVDIYDGARGSMSVTTLSEPRTRPLVATVDAKLLLVGGTRAGKFTSAVDIYDSERETWTTATLSVTRGGPAAAVAVVGRKAIFAGGNIGTTLLGAVDIYDDATGEWSTATLSEARQNIDVAVVDTKAIFAGGRTLDEGRRPVPSRAVDVYDIATGQWSSGTRPLAQWAARVLVAGIFFGGFPQTSAAAVEIYDVRSGEWSTQTPFLSRTDVARTTVGTKLLFAGGGFSESDSGRLIQSDRVDIYDTATGEWATSRLQRPRSELAVVTAGTRALFAGGSVGRYTSALVDIFHSWGPGRDEPPTARGARPRP